MSPLLRAHIRPHLERDRALVDRDHLGGASARGSHGKRADVAVGIEHAPALGELLDAPAHRSLIEVKAGLLRERERKLVVRPRSWNEERGWPRRRARTGARWKVLALRREGTRAIDDRARRENLAKRFENHGLAPLHSDGAELNAITSSNISTTRPGRSSPSAWTSRKPFVSPDGKPKHFAPRKRAARAARRKKRGVDPRRLVAHHDAHRNRRARRIKSTPDEVAARVDHPDLVSGDRSPFDALDGLRINPGVTCPNGLHVTGFQGERWPPM